MNGQHTPGPWLWLGTEGTVAMIVDEDGYSIAQVTVLENSTAHHALQANLRLMTAAPDLLDALASLLGALEADCMDDKSNVYRSMMISARAAIERATGGH